MKDNPFKEKSSKIIEGRAWTECDTKLLTDLPEERQQIVKQWIADNIEPSSSVNNWISSYGLKHCLETDTGIYLTNNQFKDAMLLSGHEPVDELRMKWHFRIRKLE